MLASVTRVVRCRQPFPAQRWLSTSSARKQLDFASAGQPAIQGDAESQSERRTKGRDAREDPTYEQWLETVGKQYKRSNRRNWLGGSVVRRDFAFSLYYLWLMLDLLAISTEPLLQTPYTSL